MAHLDARTHVSPDILDSSQAHATHTCSRLLARQDTGIVIMETSIMETSSPLAALRPGYGQRDIFRSHGGLLGATSLGGGLHDQYAFQRPNEQYFNLKTVRGSSPGASLAADLSQNFKLSDSRLVDPSSPKVCWTRAYKCRSAAAQCSRLLVVPSSQRPL